MLHTPIAHHPRQEAAAQLQPPALHVCPAAHVPHALPADPHALVDWLAPVTHVAPWQQPVEQEPGVHVHAPALPHACPVPHFPHAAPPVPHWVAI